MSDRNAVSLGVTHQIKIDGMDSWVRADVQLITGPNETVGDTWDRASAVLTTKIVAEIEKQAHVIMEANKKH